MPTARLADLVVVVPGIMGSVLSADGRQVWTTRLAVMGRQALTGLKDLRALGLPDGIGDDDPDDGVHATDLLPGLHVFPGLSVIDGYAGLLDRFDFSVGNLAPFPYDWRASIRACARHLARHVRNHLSAWRDRSGNAAAKTILICHSMGGLIARYYLEVLGGRDDARTLITIGTPYRGSVNALHTLVNGVAPALGPVSAPLTTLVRSLPSVHQLLPTYRCLTQPDSSRVDLAVGLPHLDPVRAADAARLHDEIDQAIHRNGPAPYRTHVFGGYRQPTRQGAYLCQDKLEIHDHLDGEDHRGDGTVPRFSCFPPEWPDDQDVRHFAQKHGALQNTRTLLRQIEAILTARDPRQFLAPSIELAVDLPDIATDGACPVRVETGHDRLALAITAQDTETGQQTRPRTLRNLGDGTYHTTLHLPPGSWRVTVDDATPTRAVQPVTDIVISPPAPVE